MLNNIHWKKGFKAISQLGSVDSTSTIVEIISSFNGDSRERQMREWANTEAGLRYIKGERLVYDEYKDKENSLGQALYYLNDGVGDLVPRNIRGATPREAWGLWNVDTHDISHVITGYGTDGLGEILRAEHAKAYEGRGWMVVRLVVKLRFWTPYFFKNPKLFFRWRKQLKEARVNGKKATPYLYENWFEYLERDLDAIRRYQHITPPSLYT